MPKKPRKHAARLDETPKAFGELKPPGYWNGARFVEVRRVSDAEFRARSFLFDPEFWAGVERSRAKANKT